MNTLGNKECAGCDLAGVESKARDLGLGIRIPHIRARKHTRIVERLYEIFYFIDLVYHLFFLFKR